MIINLYGCSMNKKDWEEPEQWRPERFLDGSFNDGDKFKTMAFGGGRRICTGAQQAVTISCTAMARFVQEFSWRVKEGDDEDNVETIQLTNYMLHPLHVQISPRAKK
jgi:ent-kaurene oxidase